ncbi:hypothetical protein N8V39_19805 [Enterobacter hormaechei subsp. steigerwaltii]|uniref:hypothetical protein n=1 Tax=Enterobacter hormaechei TaxID=158836 RepID=UPI001BD181FE|nr:hypothetical protein [Enterobacter hormaechei]MCC9382033.1 hypothetical protein [Enterobacter hormaechei subsp. steigerwaltii]MCU2299216.1 hypothetical protein [Enterobacter hormaechei subsp. steigerwaltii]MCU2321067.1 hypothetical protein [Enterobacter hormaechei subsp. steigerwaltii]MCU2334742.1 hypothetical protein [Enterobacter hormaechei subsp. steigerwaltii]MCU2341960.1 hypothetical protein [Enterobacter hormaechei subsp. steigerwaltii]
MAVNNENIKQLVARLKDIHERTGMNFPAWMMDENRSGDHELTAAEQQEWAEIICESMRGTVALLYLIECEKRWGLREGEYVFKSEEEVLGLTRVLIENVLIKYVEEDLLRHKPTERYMAVFQFYWANDQRVQAGEASWFNELLDGIFLDVASRLRAGRKPPVKPILH